MLPSALMGRSPLFERFPTLQGRVPWTPLGRWPTPVARLDGLSRRLGGELWVKCDDLSAPRYGGNKVRKLEHLLAQAQARRADRVVTVGGIGSNHIVATAVFAAELGMSTSAVVVPQPVTPAVHRNLALARALDVELIPCAARPLVPLCLSGAKRRAGPAAFLIGPGGSSPVGTLGYVSAGLELGAQVASGLLPEPDEIYLALGSGGSMAGLALGCAAAGLRSVVVGVRVVERLLTNLTLVRLLVRRTRRLLRAAGLEATHLPAPRMRVVHGYLGRCYGAPTEAGVQALALARESDRLELETTYTAKALAAFIDECRARPGRTVLFWNTYNSRDTGVLLEGRTGAPLPGRIQGWVDRDSGSDGDPGRTDDPSAGPEAGR